MNKLHLITLLLAFCMLSCSEIMNSDQKGLKMIAKAESYYQAGQIDQALDLLNEAYDMDYGSCGNAYAEAWGKIDHLKILIYLEKGDYLQTRMAIDSSRMYGGNLDSLRIITYQSEIGKKALSQLIDASLDNLEIEWTSDSQLPYVIIPLSNQLDTLRLEAVHDVQWLHSIKPLREKEEWIAQFKLTEKYKMLKQ